MRDVGAQPWLMYQWVSDVEQREGVLRMRVHCLSIHRAWHNREWRRDQYLEPQLVKAVVGPSAAGCQWVAQATSMDGISATNRNAGVLSKPALRLRE